MTSKGVRKFTSMEVEGVHPFHKKRISLNFDPRVNVFIGSNATGKSTLLKLMVFGETKPRLVDPPGFTYVQPMGPLPLLTDVPHIYISPIRIGLDTLPPNENDPSKGDEFLNEMFLPPSPAYTSLLASDSESEEENFLSETRRNVTYAKFAELHKLFSDNTLYYHNWRRWQTLLGQSPGYDFDGALVYWAMNRLYREDQENNSLKSVHVRNVAYWCARLICPEVLIGREPQNTFFEDTISYLDDVEIDSDDDSDGIEGQVPTQEFGTSFQTPDTDKRDSIHLSLLSTGTQGLYVWIWYLALRIAFYYEFKSGWNTQPAVLLIDEIENHLHPTWQRRVIPALLEVFPGLQIFATTHSPFVVAGLKAGQVHVLSRDDNGAVRVSKNERDVVGWTADEILRGMMGVDEPTDDATARAAQELRKLRQEEPRASEQEEEERQKRMQELRQLVNRDLLAGGPMAAQRELFEQNLADILEEHRRKQGLNQD